MESFVAGELCGVQKQCPVMWKSCLFSCYFRFYLIFEYLHDVLNSMHNYLQVVLILDQFYYDHVQQLTTKTNLIIYWLLSIFSHFSCTDLLVIDTSAKCWLTSSLGSFKLNNYQSSVALAHTAASSSCQIFFLVLLT